MGGVSMAGRVGRSGEWALLIALSIAFAVFLLKEKLTEPPPVASSAPFDTERAFARLQRILGDERPHPVDSDANDAVRDRLLGEIRELGFEPEVRDAFSCRSSVRLRSSACARVRNIVFRAGPPGANAILVASHYDSVPAGPGASDDGAGVAASLEIAAQVQGATLERPVIFLITDGEEEGLLGAASFVRNDPYAKDVAAVVNMEARGVEGPAIMFESGAPNGRELRTFSENAPHPVGNSLATAIYKMMPNDTDMTEFLALKPDALNFAYTGRVAYYHTPNDRLANLDRRSLGHIGASAMGSVKGLLRAETGGAEEDLAFFDIMGRILIIMPHALAVGFFVAGIGAGLVLYMRSGGGGLVRALLVPFAAAILGGGIAYGAFFVIGLIRPGEMFWSAYPAASQSVLYLSAIFGAAASFVLLGANANRGRLASAAWLWFLALGAAAYHYAPGSAGVTAPLAAVFAASALIALAAPRALGLAMAAAAAAAFVIWAPLLAFAESALGLGAGWTFAAPAALLVCLLVPAALSDAGRPGWRVVAGVFGALVVALIAAIAVPAHSPRAPSPLNIVQYRDGSSGASLWVLPYVQKPPSKLAAAAPFEKQSIGGYEDKHFAAPAPDFDLAAPSVEVLEQSPQADRRRLKLRIAADGADAYVIVIPKGAGLAALNVGENSLTPEGDGDWTLRCSGRSCQSFEFEAVVGASPAAWDIYSTRHGLGPSASGLQKARTRSETPIQNGDVQRVWASTKV